MSRFASRDAARDGPYRSARLLDARFVGTAGERIEGLACAACVRAPSPVAVALSPLVTALFVGVARRRAQT